MSVKPKKAQTHMYIVHRYIVSEKNKTRVIAATLNSCQVQNYMVRTSLSLIILAMVQSPYKKKDTEGGAGDSRCYQVNI